jgi:hypothetical protein
VTVIVLGQALKLTFTVYWMPAMTDGKRLRDALKSQGKEARAQSWKVFGIYFASVYFVFIVNVVAFLCTLGSALLITLPASYFFFICEQYVCYYTVQGKRYFVSHDRIADNPDRGDVEHYFDYVQSGEAQQLAIEEIALAPTSSETVSQKENVETAE